MLSIHSYNFFHMAVWAVRGEISAEDILVKRTSFWLLHHSHYKRCFSPRWFTFTCLFIPETYTLTTLIGTPAYHISQWGNNVISVNLTMTWLLLDGLNISETAELLMRFSQSVKFGVRNEKPSGFSLLWAETRNRTILDRFKLTEGLW